MMIKMSEHLKPVKALSKPHKGIVVDNSDPKKLGRVKCSIVGLLEAAKEDLPWIIPHDVDPTKFDAPELNSELVIEFPEGIYFPMYTGYWHNTANHNIYFDNDYPNTFGIIKQDFKMKYNKTSKEGEIIHPTGTKIEVKADGALEITLAKGIKITVAEDYEITADGKVTINGKTAIDLLSEGDIKIIGDSSVEVSSDGTGKFSGKGGTDVGDSSSMTNIDGSIVNIAGGGLGVAMLTAQCVGVGFLGFPVLSNIIEGSSKVFVPK